MKRLRMILRYGAEGASSRVRGLELARVMAREVAILTPDDPHWRRRYYTAAISPRTLYLQKRASKRDIDVARLRRRMGACTVFDLDDAPGGVEELAEQEARVAEMMATASAVTVGGHALEQFARQHAGTVAVIPSAVDTDVYHPDLRHREPTDRVAVGWIGNGAGYIDELRDLARIVGLVRRETPIEVRIVGAMNQAEIHDLFSHEDDRVVDAIDWRSEDAIARTVAGFDIGVYPLNDTRYNAFKCGYKAIQYMSLGLPVVASPTGENARIVRDGGTGFLAADDEAWVERIVELARDETRRRQLGDAGRAVALEHFSLERAAGLLEELLERIESS